MVQHKELSAYNGKQVLITGGLGFIGSNLAIRLVQLGARVTVLDILWPDHGGNPYNVDPVRKDLTVNICDIRDKYAVETLVRNHDFIFHLAGQCSHVLGQVDPYPDIDINIRGTAILMEAIRERAPEAVTVYTSTRGVYGHAEQLPAGEGSPTNPKGLYEISNLTAEKIINFYGEIHRLKVINLRLSNIYGERAQMRHSKFGVVNWFVRKALEDETIKVFGDGKIRRDFLYVADCVDAILQTGASEQAFGGTFNVGNEENCSFMELVNTIIDVAGSGRWEYAPFTRERAAQEPGDFYPDISRIRETTGWHPGTTLRDGLLKTIEYYRQHRAMYW
ncbi:MAG: GDP-mannose 4,6-dehydratase [Nitrospirae bacterium]|nr:GDP-mannose 4,6-dehydratase [Nitrospirota bacterium]